VPDDDLRWLDAVGHRDLVADGDATAAELAEAAIARIEAANPALNAVAVPLADVGRAAAADPALPRGPLHGVPFMLKDAGACLAGLPRGRACDGCGWMTLPAHCLAHGRMCEGVQ